MTSTTSLDAARDASRAKLSWLQDTSWPAWLEHGVDWERRGFRENLDLTTFASPAEFRRLRVAARQTLVFASAARAGVARAAEAAELGLDFLLKTARQEDGGYAWRFDLDSNVLDHRRDLYDHAFVLLAIASGTTVRPPAGLRQRALALLDYLDTRFAHPLGGYIESLPPASPRRQNPHMHLLEAFLAASDAFQDEIFLVRAGDMVRLFLDHFFDAAQGTLPEYYDDDLRPRHDAGRYGVEPGHHCEWVWLLDWYNRSARSSPAVRDACDQASARLLDVVDRFGINPVLGAAYDEIWNDGTLKAADSRLWPQTERLKAEVLRPDATPDGVLNAYRALDLYLATAPAGLWFERLRPDGTPVAEPAPASSLYHLSVGILVANRYLAGMVHPRG